MTLVLLCIAIVAALIAIVWAYRAESRIDEAEEKFGSLKTLCMSVVQRHKGQIESLEDQSNIHYEKIGAVALICDEIKGRLVLEPTAKAQIAELRKSLAELSAQRLPVHASHELLSELERQLGELRDQVAGMMVSREVLTEPTFDEEIVFPEPRTVARYRLTPDPSFQAAHASTDEPCDGRWNYDGIDDQQTSEDEQATGVMDEPPIRCGDGP